MTASEIVQSWKDEDYQGAGMAFMPGNPAGLIELTDEELLGVEGANPAAQVVSALVSASAGGLLSIAVTVAAITIYKALTS
jgi:mersacidin/lichenicidin family type 2 lantibiotic